VPNPQREQSLNLAGLSHQQLSSLLQDRGEAAFRGSQLFKWIHARRVFDFDSMTDLSREFRERLSHEFTVLDLELERRVSSGRDACEKYLLRLRDGERVEAVWMDFERRRTLCISTQVGCALGCSFCATATLGLRRNLDAGEIVQQVLYVQSLPDRSLSNVVLMGMGEPLQNYENVVQALRILNDDRGLGLSRRRMTVSTAGLVPGILRLADEQAPCKLAVSLNAVDDETRSRLMPINRKFGLDPLLAACKQYTEITGLRVTFEYVLLEGVNDSPGDIRALRSRLSRLPCKLNLISYNSTDRGFKSSGDEVVQRFAAELKTAPFPVMLRRSMGTDIDAACGQLLASGKGEGI